MSAKPPLLTFFTNKLIYKYPILEAVETYIAVAGATMVLMLVSFAIMPDTICLPLPIILSVHNASLESANLKPAKGQHNRITNPPP